MIYMAKREDPNASEVACKIRKVAETTIVRLHVSTLSGRQVSFEVDVAHKLKDVRCQVQQMLGFQNATLLVGAIRLDLNKTVAEA